MKAKKATEIETVEEILAKIRATSQMKASILNNLDSTTNDNENDIYCYEYCNENSEIRRYVNFHAKCNAVGTEKIARPLQKTDIVRHNDINRSGTVCCECGEMANSELYAEKKRLASIRIEEAKKKHEIVKARRLAEEKEKALLGLI